MKFEDEITNEDNREQYKQLKRDASQINSRVAAWIGTYDSLHAKVDADKQAELEAGKVQFVNMLKATIGI